MIKGNIWETLIDSLRYYKTGDYHRFSFCFERTLEYLELYPSSLILNKLKRRYFYTLNRLGIIEVDSYSNLTQWSIVPVHAVVLNNNLILISNTKEAEQFQTYNINAYLDVFELYCEDNTIAEYCKVNLLKISTKNNTFNELSSKLNIEVAENPSWRYLQRIPQLGDITKEFLTPINELPPSELEESQTFDFESNRWRTISSQDFINSALIRTKNKYQQTRIFLRVFGDGAMNSFRVSNIEWSQLIAANEIKVSAGCKYDELKREFKVPSNIFLPTIIDRLLFSYTFRPPKFKDYAFIYEGVPIETAKIIKNTYPYLLRSF